mgnify:CR=1 FL=1
MATIIDNSTEKMLTRTLIAGVDSGEYDIDDSMKELENLCEAGDLQVVCQVVQKKDNPENKYYLGEGKMAEVKELCHNNQVELCVFDCELTGSQIKNISDFLEIEVIDRTMLILEIFSKRATTAEGKLQTELALLKYQLPRLSGMGASLSRQGGGIGSRGPGESKLETDRRHLKEKISALESRLKELEENRAVMRAKRDRSAIPKIGIVGYTNAGKSMLLNKLTGAGVLSENKLFATLDATTRKAELPTGESVLFTDTVGFIRKLPHHLVRAFKSTLDEVCYSDLLLIVSDINDSEVAEHIKVTEQVIEELGAAEKPRLYVYNKCDIYGGVLNKSNTEKAIYISAKTGEGIDVLLESIANELSHLKCNYKLLIPYDRQTVVNALYANYTVISTEYVDNGVLVEATLDERGHGMYRDLIIEQ